MIERRQATGGWLLMQPESGLKLVSIERAYVECGCSVYGGMWLHNQEYGTLTWPCENPAHQALLEQFTDAFKESIAELPEARPAMEVADEYLQMVFAEEAA